MSTKPPKGEGTEWQRQQREAKARADARAAEKQAARNQKRAEKGETQQQRAFRESGAGKRGAKQN